MKKNNLIDRFLNFYKESSKDDVEYIKVYKRPNKIKCAFMFAFTLFIIVILFRFFLTPNIMFALIFIVDLTVCIYYGYNLFSKNGYAIGRTVAVKKEEIKDE